MLSNCPLAVALFGATGFNYTVSSEKHALRQPFGGRRV